MQVIEDDGGELEGGLEVVWLAIDVFAPACRDRGVGDGGESE